MPSTKEYQHLLNEAKIGMKFATLRGRVHMLMELLEAFKEYPFACINIEDALSDVCNTYLLDKAVKACHMADKATFIKVYTRY